MFNVSEYVTLQKELLELEREEEKKESIAAGDGKKLFLLEQSGIAICRLSVESTSSDVGGRQVVKLVTRGGRQLAPARISAGDLVAIREQKGRDSASGTAGVLPVTEGVVTAMDEKSVEVACDEPISDDLDGGTMVAVTKISSDVTHKRYSKSLDVLERAASDPTHDSYSLIQTIFGDSPPRVHESISLDEKQRRFISSLNEAQEQSVLNALKARDLAVIHGPPGTGKTHTLVAYIMIEVLRGSRVLVVAPSNVAIDNIAERLADVDPSPDFVRAGHPARIMPRVLKHSLEYQVQRTDEAKLAKDIRAELTGLDDKVRKTCEKSKRRAIRMEQRQLRKELRKREKSAVQRLLTRKQVILSTITGAGARVLDIAESTSPFDVVVVDESAQALQAACWVPLLRARKAVLAGDPHQLSGTVKSQAAESRGLKKSILDRIFCEESLQGTISMLVTQYRMNETISTWSSKEFYDGLLEPDTSVSNRRVIDMESCVNAMGEEESLIHPFILIDTAGGDCEEEAQSQISGHGLDGKLSRSDLHASRSNKGEAHILNHVVNTFVKSGIPVRDIGVISPYSGQVELLRNQLWPTYGRSLEVATIDSFQGREKEIICMSLVRSNEAGEVGFLTDDRRMNVAITRARRCVVVVCDTETISTHPLLERMVEYVEKHGYYRSAVVDFPEIVGTFSQQRRPREAIAAEQKSVTTRRKRNKIESVKSKDTRKKSGKQAINPSTENSVEDSSALAAFEEIRSRLRPEIQQFMHDGSLLEKVFPVNLTSAERRVVHELAEEYTINHQSFGEQGERRIKLWKPKSHVEHQVSHDGDRTERSSSPPLLHSSKATTSEERTLTHTHTSEKIDANDLPSSSMNMPAAAPSKESQYLNMNSLLHEIGKAREARTKQNTVQETASAPPPSQRKERKKKKDRRRRGDSDEDFDAVLAEFGAKQDEAGPSRFSGPVAQIVNGRLTAAVPIPKVNSQARQKLAAKLSKEAEKRKRQPKR